jgi:NADPH-dependent ferric siderophore reductase
VPDAREELAIELPAGGRLQWVHCDGAPAATTSHLADALRALTLPSGSGQAWGAAESRIARALRSVGPARRPRPATNARAREGLLAWLGDWDDDEG